MIGKLKGLVEALGESELLLDVGGVVYLVQAGQRTLQALMPGEQVGLPVETHVREDMIRLYGFLCEEDRAWFVRLQMIQGVGPKAALAILDVLTPEDLLSAAAMEDSAAIARAHGVGPKLAQRIVTELKDKPVPALRVMEEGGPGSTPPLQGHASSSPQPPSSETSSKTMMDKRRDARSVLINLGLIPQKQPALSLRP